MKTIKTDQSSWWVSFSANIHYELTHFNQTGEVTTRDALNIDLNSF